MRTFVLCKVGQPFLTSERIVTTVDIKGKEHTSIVAEDEIVEGKVGVSVVEASLFIFHRYS